MKKALNIIGVIAAVLVLSSMTAYSFANAPARGSMGVWGYVAAEKNAKLELAEKQSASSKLTVDRVVAPADAWIVVHMDDNGMPGKRVGLVHVAAGTTTDVTVPLTGVDGDKLIVAVHADRGTPNTFDFDMDKKTQSADRPFFVNGSELAKVVQIN